MRQLVLGTAGHIDHGKTALVRALTGVDTDRLPEEKRRGITIDLGFASMALDGDTQLGIVDVPGHEAFIRNMLAGATGIDLVLLVIAADEGVMPQTREHLAIVELLGISRGVVALTKADLVEAEWLELVRDDVAGLLAGTALADAPVIAVSARTGAGLDVLVEHLAGVAAHLEERRSDDVFRMPIDRVFTVRGTGTVVTGTVWSGSLERDVQVRIEPAGLTARVRGLQCHGTERTRVAAGERAAVALAGVDRDRLGRGDALLGGAGWHASMTLTIELTVLGDAAAVRPRQRVRVHLGTAEVLARLALPDGVVEPGGSGLAQLRLEAPLIARAGDRLVIRSWSPMHTLAGGLVLEPLAPRRRRLTDDVRTSLLELRTAARRPQALLHLAGPDGIHAADLPVTAGIPAGAALAALEATGAVRAGDRFIASGHLAGCRARILDALTAHHAAAPLQDGLEREALRRAASAAAPAALFEAAMAQLHAEGRIEGRDGVVALAGFRARPGPAEQPVLEELAAIYAAAGLQSPDLTELPRGLSARPDLPLLLRFLERQARLVRLTQVRWADAAAISACVSAVRAQLPPQQPVGIAEFREVVNLSRKHLLPILEYFDRSGVTVRHGDVRVIQPASEGGDAAVAPAPAPTS